MPLVSLTRLASVLERTKNVRRLVLRGCGIGAVPDGVWHLPLLRSLDLSGNRLDSLRVPDNGGLALEELVLSDNPQLRVFDAGKGALPILRTLDLRCDSRFQKKLFILSRSHVTLMCQLP